MSQFDQPYSDPSVPSDYHEPGLPRTSSLICCLPITTIPGIILGVAALGAMSKNPNLTGRGLAIAGIVLGIIFTIGQGVIALAIVRGHTELQETPMRMLEPGFAGDYAGLRDNFGTHGQPVSDEQAEAFIAELRDRYGELIGSDVAFWESIQAMQQQPGEPEVRFLGELIFERQRVDIEFTLDLRDAERHDHPVIGSIRIIDPNRGDIVFPPPEEPGEAGPEEVEGEEDEESAIIAEEDEVEQH
jgi:hypothetical protein